jgi:hypothetical protein
MMPAAFRKKDKESEDPIVSLRAMKGAANRRVILEILRLEIEARGREQATTREGA